MFTPNQLQAIQQTLPEINSNLVIIEADRDWRAGVARGRQIIRELANPSAHQPEQIQHTEGFTMNDYNDESISYHIDGTAPQSHQIFVFGSNLSGVHGAGAAKYALNHCGAVWGRPHGLMGNSYAIPTKNESITATLSLSTIADFVTEFTRFVTDNPGLQFFMTRIGCGLAGLSDEQVAPMFYPPLPNVDYPTNWQPYLNPTTMSQQEIVL